MKRIYLDYASLTPVDKGVLEVTNKYSVGDYGNPSALYRSAVNAKKVMQESREKIAKVLHAHSDEIFFTASGTEANNLSLRGIKGKHIIVSAVEHSSVMETAAELEKKGIKVTYLPVDKNGIVDLDKLKEEIKKDTVLVSIMMVNNEIGTIEPIQEILKIIRAARKNNNSIYPILHTDACQASYLPIHLEKMGVDLLTFDGHKIYGPRGVGMLYKRRGIELEPVIYGGGQEEGLRSGTENIPGIAGFAFALELADKMREKEWARLSELKKMFVRGILEINKEIKINGGVENTSPHILNISIPDIESEFFVLQLDARGIECSTKSACLNDQEESYVLESIGAESGNSVRFSFGRGTMKDDIGVALKIIREILKKS